MTNFDTVFFRFPDGQAHPAGSVPRHHGPHGSEESRKSRRLSPTPAVYTASGGLLEMDWQS